MYILCPEEPLKVKRNGLTGRVMRRLFGLGLNKIQGFKVINSSFVPTKSSRSTFLKPTMKLGVEFKCTS